MTHSLLMDRECALRTGRGRAGAPSPPLVGLVRPLGSAQRGRVLGGSLALGPARRSPPRGCRQRGWLDGAAEPDAGAVRARAPTGSLAGSSSRPQPALERWLLAVDHWALGAARPRDAADDRAALGAGIARGRLPRGLRDAAARRVGGVGRRGASPPWTATGRWCFSPRPRATSRSRGCRRDRRATLEPWAARLRDAFGRSGTPTRSSCTTAAIA